MRHVLGDHPVLRGPLLHVGGDLYFLARGEAIIHRHDLVRLL